MKITSINKPMKRGRLWWGMASDGDKNYEWSRIYLQNPGFVLPTRRGARVKSTPESIESKS